MMRSENFSSAGTLEVSILFTLNTFFIEVLLRGKCSRGCNVIYYILFWCSHFPEFPPFAWQTEGGNVFFFLYLIVQPYLEQS